MSTPMSSDKSDKSSDPDSDPSREQSRADEVASDLADRPPPPATLEFLVHTLFTQALMALGRIPNPITGKSHRNLPTARHFIDTIAMLDEKTAGNRTADESRVIEEVLHQARLQFATDAGSKRD
ncbi:MAG: DUF1844 domain-containing protein [Planctomycetaceae bacterium]